VQRLQETVRGILDGKDVKIPVKEPGAKEDHEMRNKEINEILKKNR